MSRSSPFRALAAALVTAVLLAPATAAAQMQLLPPGAYELTLTPATGDSRALTGAAPIRLDAYVIHTGAETTITTSDSITLRGASSATHLKASGPMHGAVLTLELGGSGAQASGTWLLRGRGTHQVTGTVTVASASGHPTRPVRRSDCVGFRDCVRHVAGYDWNSFF